MGCDFFDSLFISHYFHALFARMTSATILSIYLSTAGAFLVNLACARVYLAGYLDSRIESTIRVL